MLRLAIVVSHPIQYYVPLYRRLAARSDLEIKVFFTWHGGGGDVYDQGFQRPIAWDIPLTDGYQSGVVPNTARDPGTHHFRGLQNPELVGWVKGWNPDAVHLTGYSYASHLTLMRAMARTGIPLLFRGDSHLLDERAGLKSFLKRILLRKVFSWPSAFLFVGRNNRAYYESFGVPEEKLSYCPHSIEVSRFSEPSFELERRATEWRRELKIPEETVVGLFAGKFETKKRPIELMKWFLDASGERSVLVMAGSGEHEAELKRLAASAPERFRVLPFQNQSLMPVLYRVGDFLILPSAFGETWGLAENEAQACGRPVLVSDRVGCAPEMVIPGQTGEIFTSANSPRRSRLPQHATRLEGVDNGGAERGIHPSFSSALNRIVEQLRSGAYSRERILNHARQFDISETVSALMNCLRAVVER